MSATSFMKDIMNFYTVRKCYTQIWKIWYSEHFVCTIYVRRWASSFLRWLICRRWQCAQTCKGWYLKWNYLSNINNLMVYSCCSNSQKWTYQHFLSPSCSSFFDLPILIMKCLVSSYYKIFRLIPILLIKIERRDLIIYDYLMSVVYCNLYKMWSNKLLLSENRINELIFSMNIFHCSHSLKHIN